MGLIGLLFAILIIIFFWFFSNSASSLFNKNPIQPQNIENNASDAVNKATENKKIENDQIKNIDVQ